jgi:hypothetical protein
MINGYQIVSEVVTGNPNVDMLITKAYLYVYIEKESIDRVKARGLSVNDENIIQAMFTRLPENKYEEYLIDHAPVKISVAKLSKIKGQKVVIKPVNFDHPKDSLDEDDIQKILDDSSLKLLSMMRKQTDISKLPRVDIQFSGDRIPAFALKVLDVADSDDS